jgi:hypothetical protein
MTDEVAEEAVEPAELPPLEAVALEDTEAMELVKAVLKTRARTEALGAFSGTTVLSVGVAGPTVQKASQVGAGASIEAWKSEPVEASLEAVPLVATAEAFESAPLDNTGRAPFETRAVAKVELLRVPIGASSGHCNRRAGGTVVLLVGAAGSSLEAQAS